MSKDIEKVSTKNLCKILEFVLIKDSDFEFFTLTKDSDCDHPSLK